MNSDIHIVLYQPVIPQNTGSIARLCACTGASLHLIHPLGFQVDAASVKRAGLDYWPHVAVHEHENWEAFEHTTEGAPVYFFSKFAKRPYSEIKFPGRSYIVFGSETKGLPEEIRTKYADNCYLLPMRTNLVRSLNLSQCAAIITYEALRQHEFGSLLGNVDHYAELAPSAAYP